MDSSLIKDNNNDYINHIFIILIIGILFKILIDKIFIVDLTRKFI